MLIILLSVVVITFAVVMMPGPIFAVTLAKSYKSPWAGAKISLGHAVIEVPIILLIYFGFAQFFQNDVVQLVLSILGGGMIIWLGMSMFRARAEVVQRGKDLPYNAFVAGILTSGLNPFFLLWWATIGSMLVMKFLDFEVRGLTGRSRQYNHGIIKSNECAIYRRGWIYRLSHSGCLGTARARGDSGGQPIHWLCPES